MAEENRRGCIESLDFCSDQPVFASEAARSAKPATPATGQHGQLKAGTSAGEERLARKTWSRGRARRVARGVRVMTHKCRGSIVAFSTSKSVEPNEEQKEMISSFQ